MPTHMAKAGVSYVFPLGITLGVFNSYYSARYDVVIAKPTRRLVNPTADAYNWLSANLGLNINKLCSLDSKLKYEILVYGENLLDTAVYDPDFNRMNINTLPARAGRTVMGEIKVSF